MPSMILYCNCCYSDVIPVVTRRKVLAALMAAGRTMITLPDLCRTAVHDSERLKALAEFDDLKIVACYPRVVRGLLKAAGIDLNVTEIFNMRTRSAEDICHRLCGMQDIPLEMSAPVIEKDGDWIPWFPVIDEERCCNCKQCLSFCLFGVYDLTDEGRVAVQAPQNCKTNCPACARICPEVAIMFPKYDQAPINGAEIEDEQLEKQKVKVNLAEILGDDPYAALALRRRRNKLSLLKQQNFARALAEREACAADPAEAPREPSS